MPSDRLTRIAAVIRIPPQRGGWLEVICGPMFSGKSEEMIRRLRRAEIAGQRVVILKPQHRRPLRRDRRRQPRGRADARRPDLVARTTSSSAPRASRSSGSTRCSSSATTIVARALELADRGVRVVVAGLDQDFRRLPFGPMPELLSHAEFVDKLQAVCHRCGGPATTTQRLVDGQPAPYSGETVVVGAAEQYEARCRGCHEAGVGAALVAA